MNKKLDTEMSKDEQKNTLLIDPSLPYWYTSSTIMSSIPEGSLVLGDYTITKEDLKCLTNEEFIRTVAVIQFASIMGSTEFINFICQRFLPGDITGSELNKNVGIEK